MPRAVRTLGEIALRVNDLEVMAEFYEKIVGLELMRAFPGIVFFRIGEGYGGHTTILALFDRDTAVGSERTTLDHLAFTIDIADYATERERLQAAGVEVRPEVFEWVGWRSLFIRDPEGNTVEFVCRDPELIPE
jgi:catechol-2,3-dioxygenase